MNASEIEMQAANRPVRVVVDSAADLPPHLARELDIVVIPLLVHIQGKVYREGIDIGGEEFFRKLDEAHSVTTTSIPELEAFAGAYRELTASGFKVVSIHMSSSLSGAFNAALIASTADNVPAEAISVIDTRTMSMAHGFIAIRAAEAARAGAGQQEIEVLVEGLAAKARLFGVLDTLEYVVRSGRVGRLPGNIGDMLGVKPIITINQQGEAHVFEISRSRKQALERLVALTVESGPLDGLAVMHGGDPEGAQQLAEMLAAAGTPEPVVGHIGAVLGTHIGSGALGVCLLQK